MEWFQCGWGGEKTHLVDGKFFTHSLNVEWERSLKRQGKSLVEHFSDFLLGSLSIN